MLTQFGGGEVGDSLMGARAQQFGRVEPGGHAENMGARSAGGAQTGTAVLEGGHLEGLLFVHPHPPLRQFQYARLTDDDLQSVIQQFALDALLMFAPLRQLVGAASQKVGAADGGACK